MSNLIKSPFVSYNSDDKVVIKHEEDPDFVPLEKTSKVILRPLGEEKNEEGNFLNNDKDGDVEEEFAPGVPIVNYEEILREKEAEADEAIEQMLKEAREEAIELVNQANEQAEQIKNQAVDEGIEIGRQQGLESASEEIDSIKASLEEQKQALEKEYNDLISEAEVKYVDVLCMLLEKVTGVIMTDKKDVLLHLIRSSIMEMEPSKKYILRVSSDDVLMVEAEKEAIAMQAGLDTVIEVQEEKGLNKDECIIETERQMIDCGFKTQLDNLISTLRLLAQ